MPLPSSIAALEACSELQRKLVTIRQVAAIQPCTGSHVKEVAIIDGWRVVVDKDVFKPDDLVIFCEVDSFLPSNNPMFKEAFGIATPSRYNGVNGYRVRSVLIGKEVSQGVIFSLNEFPEIATAFYDLVDFYHGETDLALMDMGHFCFAKRLGVIKWERRSYIGGTHLGDIPAFIQKTGLQRHNNCPNLFTKAKYWHNLYQESVKLDGESMTVFFIHDTQSAYASCNPAPPDNNFTQAPNGRVGVCSHNREIAENPTSVYWQLAVRYNLPAKLSALGKSIAIQGELCGATVADNREKYPLGQHDFFIFDVWDIETKSHWDPKRTEDLAKELGCKHVPVRGYFKIRQVAQCHQSLSARAASVGKEGLVYKCGKDGRRFKVLNQQWLLDHKQ